MRDVIFRGKINNTGDPKKDGQWITGYHAVFQNLIASGKKYFIHCILCWRRWQSIDPESLGEFTGVTLPSGERLFEGDVLCSSIDLDGNGVFSEELLEVYWDEKLHGFLLRNPQYTTPCDMDTDFSDMKLVGNIHDNPDIWRTYEA